MKKLTKLGVAIPQGCTHIHQPMMNSFLSDRELDERMFEKWDPIPHKVTNYKIFTWSGKEWVFYMVGTKRDSWIKSTRIKL